MSASGAALLDQQLDEAFAMIRARIDRLTDEEFWWEPAPNCWTVRQGSDGRWSADYAEPDPVPAPLTTIAWRLVHVAECKVMYHEYAFGAARLTWDQIDSAHNARDAIALLEEGQTLLRQDLDGLNDDDLERPRATNWGEPWPTWKIFWTMIQHDIHHGAEIGMLRDLYRVTHVPDSSAAS